MEANSTPYLKVVSDVLKKRKVSLKWSEGEIHQRVFGLRVFPTSLVCPGSSSSLEHRFLIYESPGPKLHFLVFSEKLAYQQADEAEMTLIISDLNFKSDLAVWKIEGNAQFLYPVLALTLFHSSPSIENSTLIWRLLGLLDILFKETWAELISNKQVEAFLQYMDLQTVKKTLVPKGVNYSVRLSPEVEIPRTKLLLERLEVEIKNDIITFRSCLTVDERLKRYEPALEQANSYYSIGYFQNRSRELQFVYKVYIQDLPDSDMLECVRNSYEYSIAISTDFVRLFSKVLDKVLPISEMKQKIATTEAASQENVQELVLNFAGNEDLFSKTCETLKKLDQPQLMRYRLPGQCYKIETDMTIRVKARKNMISISKLLRDSRFKDKLEDMTHLLLVLRDLKIYPSLEMLFVICNPIFQIVIIPGKDWNDTQETLLNDIRRVSRNTDFEKLFRREPGYLHLSFDKYGPSSFSEIDDQLSVRPASNCLYCCYRIKEKNLTFMVQLAKYKEEESLCRNSRNPIKGYISDEGHFPIWYYVVQECHDDSIASNDSLVRIYLNSAQAAATLHSEYCFHWFINRVTIRIDRVANTLTLVLPCLKVEFLYFIYSIIPETQRKFIAPEVMMYMEEGKIVEDPGKADVYSLSRVIQDISEAKSRLQQHVFQEVSEQMNKDIKDLIRRGTSEDPGLRPTMQEVINTLKRILPG